MDPGVLVGKSQLKKRKEGKKREREGKDKKEKGEQEKKAKVNIRCLEWAAKAQE